MSRGRLIVIEGLDRSGKSTQAALLLHALTAHPSIPAAKLIKFPDRTTPIGKMIDSYLQNTSDLDDHAIHLLFSANRWELRSQLVDLISAGTWVILDRYVYSGIGFSMIKGISETWCRAPDIGLPEPDLVVFLDVSEQIAKERGGFGEERYEKAELQKQVRVAFMKLFNGLQQVTIVDAGMSIKKVEQAIWEIVKTKMEESVGKLGTIQ